MRNLPLCFLNDSWIVKLPFVRKYGCYVREIKFYDCGFTSIREVSEKSCTKCRKIIFFNCYMRGEQENEGVDNFNEFDLCGYNINFHYCGVVSNLFHKLKKFTLPIDWFLTDD